MIYSHVTLFKVVSCHVTIEGSTLGCYVLTMQCNAMQCNAMQCNAMQCNAMQCNAMQCNAMQCNAMQCNAMQCNAMQCNAMQCNAMQCNAIQSHFIFQDREILLQRSTKNKCNSSKRDHWNLRDVYGLIVYALLF